MPVRLNPGVGGAEAATENIGGHEYQGVKFYFGAPLTATPITSVTPLPVTIGLPPAAVLGDNLGNPTTSLLGSCTLVWDGSAWDRAPGNSATGLRVNLGGDTITVAGTLGVSGLTPGTGAANLGKAQNSPHAVGDVGALLLAIRRDTPGPGTSTDGGYIGLQTDAQGNLRVNVMAGGGGGGPGGGTAAVDDSAFTIGVTSETPVGGVYLTTRDLVDAGDTGAFAMTQRRALYVTLETPGGDSAMDETNDALRVHMVASSILPGTTAQDLGKAQNSAYATGHVGIMQLAVRRDTPSTFAGTDGSYGPLSLDAGGNLRVAASSGVAHGATDTENPSLLGLRAANMGAAPTAVAAGARTLWYANRSGVPFVLGGHPATFTEAATTTTAGTNVAFLAGVAGSRYVVTRASVIASAGMTATGVPFTCGFGATTTPTSTGVVIAHPGMNGGDGVTVGDGSGILGIGGSGEPIRYTVGAPTGGSVQVLLSGFILPG